MTLRKLFALTAVMLLASSIVIAEDISESFEKTSRIKTISLSFGGGYYSGCTYFELPLIHPNAQIAEGSNNLWLYDGEYLDLGTGDADRYLDAPIKKINPGSLFSADIGFYLSENFHVDLSASMAKSTADITIIEVNNDIPGERFQPTGDHDFFRNDPRFQDDNPFHEDDFTLYSGGLTLIYDATNLSKEYLLPYFGCGLGGVINRFSALEDKTALYFQFVTGAFIPITDNLKINAEIRATTYSFGTEEVVYAKEIFNATLTLGATWMIDVKPIY
ncbi:MAG: hypothetical protein GY752_03385 [bacterium]|nr:hypothetical protein [bacterium]MCP4798775.1 hypothetical protein [bacterium]